MSYNNAVSSGDPQAIEKLTEKLTKCEKLQATMKEVNTYWRKSGTCQGAPGLTEAQAQKLDTKMAAPRYSWETQPFASYDLNNNNAEIRLLKTRIAEITRNQEVGFAGWEFAGGTAVAETTLNRLQLFFDERPDKDKTILLKRNGFHWSPTEGAWQRQLNDNAIWAANNIGFLKPGDGRTVREHQPSIPDKNDRGAR
ncbi:MAG: hypothetical protein LBQ48_01215 [Oscillospiraceae bacterium]|jgi:hypothetical protein|nr:hypothetical protein [Oscillospiraceae bacterium]